LSIIPQHTWVSKLFGYDFTVEYRPGKLNGVAGALSRCEKDIAAIHAISAPTFQLFDRLCTKVQDDPEVAAMRTQLEGGIARRLLPVRWPHAVLGQNIYPKGIYPLVGATVPCSHWP
jgi:hypothetical protein